LSTIREAEQIFLFFSRNPLKVTIVTNKAKQIQAILLELIWIYLEGVRAGG
jgi:hypothetical protein